MRRNSIVCGLIVAALIVAAVPTRAIAEAEADKTILGGQPITLARSAINDNDNLPPRAVATANALSVPVLETVNFDGSQSSDPEEATLFFQWSFSDGSEPSNDPSPIHVIDAPGIYIVVLIVVDDFRQADTATLAIRVGLDGPTAVPNPPRFPYSPLAAPG